MLATKCSISIRLSISDAVPRPHHHCLLGAVQDSIQSTIPAMGYTVTYAIGNTMLILMGVFIAFIV